MAIDTPSPRSLGRLLSLFDVLADAHEGRSLTELSVALQAPKSSLLKLLRPLVADGYLSHGARGYQLGPSIYRLANKIASTRDFNRLMRPFIEELAARCGEGVYLSILDRDHKVGIHTDGIPSTQAVRYVPPIGRARPLYCTASGRLLLAYQDKAWLDDYFRTVKLVPLTEKTLIQRNALKRELKKIREEGVAITVGQTAPGAAGIAAPVWGEDGTLAAALIIAAPEQRFMKRLPELRKWLVETAARASGAAGG